MFMLFASRLASKSTAFCTVLPCVLHQNALHLAPKRIAFCIKTQAILHQNAPKLAANSPQSGVNGALFKLIFILPAWTTNPF